MAYMLRQADASTLITNRTRRACGVVATGGRGALEQMADHWSAVGELADQRSLGAAARHGLQQSDAWRNGKGVPSPLSGEASALSARISHVATACAVQHPWASTRAWTWCSRGQAPNSSQ